MTTSEPTFNSRPNLPSTEATLALMDQVFTPDPNVNAAVDNPLAAREILPGELRALRKGADLLLETVARGALDSSPAKLSRMETGESGIKLTDLEALASYYGISPESTDHAYLMGMYKTAKKRGWWESHTGAPRLRRGFAGYVMSAAALTGVALTRVPELLQTPQYSETVNKAEGDATVRLFEALRQKRGSAQPQLRQFYLLGEAVTRRSLGGPSMLAAQLDWIADRVEEGDAHVWVLPEDADVVPAVEHDHTVAVSPNAVMSSRLYVRGLLGGIGGVLENVKTVQEQGGFNSTDELRRLARAALSSEDSLEFLRERAAQLRAA